MCFPSIVIEALYYLSVKIDPETGLRTDPADPDGIFEIFREEFAPAHLGAKKRADDANMAQQIF